MSVFLSSDKAMTAPIPGTPYTNGKALYLSEFGTAAANLIGVFTASGDGLKSRAWEGTDNVFAVNGGRVVRGADLAAAVSAMLPMEGAGGMFAIDIVTRPTAGAFYVDLYRTAVQGSPNGYRIEVTPTVARLCQRVGGALTYFGSPIAISDGTRLALRWVGGSLSLIINGEEKIIVTTSAVARTGYCGISGVQALRGFELDNLMVTTY